MSLNAKQNLVGTVVIGKPNATVEMTEIEGGHKITVTDPNGVQELLIPNGEMNGIENAKFTGASGEPSNQALVLTVAGSEDPHVHDGEYLIPYLDSNRKMKPGNLPLATETTKGAMSAEDKKKLDGVQEGANKTIVNQKVERNSGQPVASGAVKYEMDKLQSMIEGKQVYEWDGNTEGRESVVGTYYTYYKVSDDTPTVEELSKVVEVMLYDPARDTLTVGYVDDYTTEHGYCELTAGGIESTRVYYEGNSAGVSAGLYFHYTPSAHGTSSPGYTRLLILGNNVIAGTYGGIADNGGGVIRSYNIPRVTVDEYGRVTEASNSVLPMATAENSGFITSKMYSRIMNGLYYSYIKTMSSGTDERIIAALSPNAISHPTIIHAYGVYTDGSYSYIVPLEYYIKKYGTDITSTRYSPSVYVKRPTDVTYDLTVYVYSNVSLTTNH